MSLSFSVQHNLLGGGRDPEDGLGPGGASRSHGHDTQAVASSIGLKPKPGGAKNKGKQKASARVVEAAEETKTCTGPLDVDLALGDAFGSPQRIRHRPPKSSGLKRGQRQTLMFDHSRQTWHMPIEVPGPPDNHSNLSTPEESPRTPGKGTAPAMLGAIEEDAAGEGAWNGEAAGGRRGVAAPDLSSGLEVDERSAASEADAGRA